MAVGLILLKREQKIMREITELRKRMPARASFWDKFRFGDSRVDKDDVVLNMEPVLPNDGAALVPLGISLPNDGATPVPLGIGISLPNDGAAPAPLGIGISLPNDGAAPVPLGISGKHISMSTLQEPIILSLMHPVLPESKSTSTINQIDDIELLEPHTRKRKSEVIERTLPPGKLRRSFSFSIGGKRIAIGGVVFKNFKERLEKKREDWSFAAYSFNIDTHAKEMKRPDLLDVIHFSHYSYMAYIKLDNEIQKKTDILLHYSPLNDLHQAPYMVSLDHDWNSVIISIRGTYSAADVLVDLDIETEMLDKDLPNPENYKAHVGFLKTAMHIVKDITENRVLERTVGKQLSREASYHIVVCGHSLGAMGHMNTRCYGYSMPSGVVNGPAASLFNDFCLSIVNGDDLVSRLSLNSCDVLKKDVTRLINNCNLPKYKIFGSALHNRFVLAKPETRKSLLQRTQNGLIPDGTDATLQDSEIERIMSSIASLPKRWRLGKNMHIYTETKPLVEPMYIPGRILYIEKQRIYEKHLDRVVTVEQGSDKRRRGGESLKRFRNAVNEKLVIAKHKSFDNKYVYSPRWADKEEFMEIIVSRTMIKDHSSVFSILEKFESLHSSVPLSAMS